MLIGNTRPFTVIISWFGYYSHVVICRGNQELPAFRKFPSIMIRYSFVFYNNASPLWLITRYDAKQCLQSLVNGRSGCGIAASHSL